MTTALDTNVISALWNDADALNRPAAKILGEAQEQGQLVICGIVYAELLAAAGRTESFVDGFCEQARISVEWELEEKVWREAGKAFQGYSVRRKRQRAREPRRLLADFLIGAHAVVNGYKLLTLDAGVYRASFPRLVVELV